MKDISQFIHGYMGEIEGKIEGMVDTMSLEEIGNYLVEKGAVRSLRDVKAFLLIEPISLLSTGEVDLPIAYYSDEEECSGEVITGDEFLTDNFIKDNVVPFKK